MSNIVFFDDVSDEVREAAEEFVAADHTERSGVLAAMDDQPAVRELVLALAERLLRDSAAGRHPFYTTSEDEVLSCRGCKDPRRVTPVRRPAARRRTFAIRSQARLDAPNDPRRRSRTPGCRTITTSSEHGRRDHRAHRRRPRLLSPVATRPSQPAAKVDQASTLR